MIAALLQLVGVPVALGLALVFPGLLLARRLRLGPAETLAVSIVLSLLALHAVLGAAFAAGLPLEWPARLLLLGAVAAAAAGAGDARRLLRRARVRGGLVAAGALLVVSLVALVAMRHHGGGDWSGDWLEHHERARLLLGRLPRDHLFLGEYPLPARPPLQNLAVAFAQGLLGDGLIVTQVASAVLAAVVGIGCWLVAPALVPGGRPRAATLAALLATAPFVVQSATFPWTKLLAAFHVLVAAWLFARGWRRDDPRRVGLAGLALSTGMLVHYSVGPFALALAAAGLWAAARGRAPRAATWLAGAAGGLLPLLSWLAWSAATFGGRATLASNSSAARLAVAKRPLADFLGQLEATLVPLPLRDPRHPFPQADAAGAVRDWVFCLTEGCLPLLPGLTAGVVAAWLGWRAWRAARAPAPWAALVLLGGLLASAAHPPPVVPWGVAHVVLQPLGLLALAALAACPRGRAWALLVAGRLLDVGLGVALHVWLQGRTFSASRLPDGTLGVDAGGLGGMAAYNWAEKEARGLTMLGDALAPLQLPARLALLGLLAWALVTLGSAPGRTPRDVARPGRDGA